MDIIIIPLIKVLNLALGAYWWAIVIYVFLGWLEHFSVVDRYNNFVFGLHTFLFRIVEPALQPIRRFLPNMGGIDLSPFVLILILYLVESMIERLMIRFPF